MGAEQKPMLGSATKARLTCDKCGAAFIQTHNGFALIDVVDKSSQFWRDFKRRTLRVEEWKAIADGAPVRYDLTMGAYVPYTPDEYSEPKPGYCAPAPTYAPSPQPPRDIGYGPPEYLKRQETEITGESERGNKEVTLLSRPPTSEDLKRLERVAKWEKEVTPSSEPNTDESPTEGESQSPKKPEKKKRYTSSQVATAAGKAVAAVGGDDLPLEGQIEALELAKRWLVELRQ